jgi:PAS domain S-box-containing protein
VVPARHADRDLVVAGRLVGTLVTDLAGRMVSCGLSLPRGLGLPSPCTAASRSSELLPDVTIDALAAQAGLVSDGAAPDIGVAPFETATFARRLLDRTRREWKLPPAPPAPHRLHVAEHAFLPVDLVSRAFQAHGATHLMVDLWLRNATVQSALARAVAEAEHSSDAVVVTDRGGFIAYANPAFETMCGHAAGALAGRNAATLQRNRGDALHESWAALRAGRSWHGMLTLHHADGRTIDEEMRLRPFAVHGGPATHFIGLGRGPR